jgi:hypothetical protein
LAAGAFALGVVGVGKRVGVSVGGDAKVAVGVGVAVRSGAVIEIWRRV